MWAGSGGGDAVDMSRVGSLKRRCNWKQRWKAQVKKGARGQRKITDKVEGGEGSFREQASAGYLSMYVDTRGQSYTGTLSMSTGMRRQTWGPNSMTEVSECSGSSCKSHLPSDWKVTSEGFANKCFPEEYGLWS